jgi:hypothetical protein
MRPKQIIKQQQLLKLGDAPEDAAEAAVTAAAAAAAAAAKEEAFVAVWHDKDLSVHGKDQQNEKQREEQQQQQEENNSSATAAPVSHANAIGWSLMCRSSDAASAVRQQRQQQQQQPQQQSPQQEQPPVDRARSASSSVGRVPSGTAPPAAGQPSSFSGSFSGSSFSSLHMGPAGSSHLGPVGSSHHGLSRLSRATGGAADLANLNMNFLPLTGVDAIDAQLHPENYREEVYGAGRADSGTWGIFARRPSLTLSLLSGSSTNSFERPGSSTGWRTNGSNHAAAAAAAAAAARRRSADYRTRPHSFTRSGGSSEQQQQQQQEAHSAEFGAIELAQPHPQPHAAALHPRASAADRATNAEAVWSVMQQRRHSLGRTPASARRRSMEPHHVGVLPRTLSAVREGASSKMPTLASPFAAVAEQQQHEEDAQSQDASAAVAEGTAAHPASMLERIGSSFRAALKRAHSAAAGDEAAELPPAAAMASSSAAQLTRAGSASHGSAESPTAPVRRPLREASSFHGSLHGSTAGAASTNHHLLHFSPAAEAVRAVGPAALGRISLPGRTQSVRDAAALYTSQILPEPMISAAPGRAGGSRIMLARMLTVAPDGQLLPPSGVAAAAAAAFEHSGSAAASAAWALPEAPVAPSHTAAAAAATRAGSSSGTDGSRDQYDVLAAVIDIPAGSQGSSGDSSRDQNNSVASNAMASEVANQPLQRLAAAVRELDATAGFREFASWLPDGAAAAAAKAADVEPDTADESAASVTPAAPTAAAAVAPKPKASAGAWGSHHTGLQPASTADSNWGTGNWGTMAECRPGNGADTLSSKVFSTQCAVIPTMPECVYEHTIAAVPNFGERAAPQSSWMFFIVNFALLALLFAASFFEVYNGGISLQAE